jgi:hypothetical protein
MYKFFVPLFALMTAAFFSRAYAGTLDTPSFIVTVEVNCPEGHVVCDDVTYTGISKKNGITITLKGSTWHTRGRDSTPGRFIGYRFQSGEYLYWVLGEGALEIRKGEKVISSEKGEWAR